LIKKITFKFCDLYRCTKKAEYANSANSAVVPVQSLEKGGGRR